MHRKQDSDLIPADTELERTLRRLRKIKRAKNAATVDERHDQTAEQRNRGQQPEGLPLLTQWRIYGGLLFRKSILQSDNLLWMQIIFELKPALITMVQQHQYTGHPTEDPNEHLRRFLRMANTVKLNVVRPEVIKLHLFPFSLRDITTTWYESLPYGSVDTWEELVEAYLGRFFPPSLTSERRREIIIF